MSQTFAEALSWVPVSATFSGTLGRAHEYASAQGHRLVTLEHLLLALAEDPDAAIVLQASNIDIPRLMSDTSTHLGHNEDRFPPGQPVDPGADEGLIRILDYAAAAARQSRRREINGAIVLAAIVGEARSIAASMLQAQGLTFEGAIRALQRAPATARPPAPAAVASAQPAALPPHPAPAAPAVPVATPQPATVDQAPTFNGSATQTNEQILANVRRRIDANRKAAAAAAAPSADREVPQPVLTSPASTISAATVASPPVEAAPRPIELPAAAPPRVVTTRAPEPAAAPYAPPPAPPPPAPIDVSEPDAGLSALPSAPLPSPPPPFTEADGVQRESFGGSAAEAIEAIRAEIEVALPARRPPPLPPGHDAPHAHPQGAIGEVPPSPLRPRQLGAPVVPPSNVPWPEPVRPQPSALPTPPPGPPAMAVPMRSPMPGPHGDYVEPDPFDGDIAGPPFPEPDTVPPRPLVNVPVPRPRAAEPLIEPGQVVENIPRQMQVGRTELVEVRIGRAGARGIMHGMHGAGMPQVHGLDVTKVMTARLRAVDGHFTIESASPETQWIENQIASVSDDFASWRWNVTPLASGASRLQLVVSARSIGADGLIGDTALPEQVFDIAVRADYGRILKRAAGWAGLMIAGGVLSRLGQGSFETVAAIWRGFQ